MRFMGAPYIPPYGGWNPVVFVIPIESTAPPSPISTANLDFQPMSDGHIHMEVSFLIGLPPVILYFM